MPCNLPFHSPLCACRALNKKPRIKPEMKEIRGMALCAGANFPFKKNDSLQLLSAVCFRCFKHSSDVVPRHLPPGGRMLHLWPPLRQVWVKRMASSSPPPSFKWSNTTHVEGPQLGASILPCGFVSRNKTGRQESRHSRSVSETRGRVPFNTSCNMWLKTRLPVPMISD